MRVKIITKRTGSVISCCWSRRKELFLL